MIRSDQYLNLVVMFHIECTWIVCSVWRKCCCKIIHGCWRGWTKSHLGTRCHFFLCRSCGIHYDCATFGCYQGEYECMLNTVFSHCVTKKRNSYLLQWLLVSYHFKLHATKPNNKNVCRQGSKIDPSTHPNLESPSWQN